MASKPPDSKEPKRQTGKSKRWNGRITLWRNAMRIRASMLDQQTALDNIFAELFEEDLVNGEISATTPPPSVETSALIVIPDEPIERPSQKPTRYYLAMGGKALVNYFVKMWAEANTKAKQDNVREVVERGLESKTLTQEEYDEIVKHLV